jgi:hypothetical protein
VEGVIQEFKIAERLGRRPIPIGSTGHAARIICDEVSNNFAKYYSDKNVRVYFDTLKDDQKTNEEIVDAIFKIIETCLKK